VTDRARNGARAVLCAGLLVAGCGRHQDAVPPLHARAGASVDAFWTFAAPALARRFEDGPVHKPVESPDMMPRLIAIAPDGSIEAGDFKVSATDATWWKMDRARTEEGSMSGHYTLGGPQWRLDVHTVDGSPVTEVTIDREGARPQILYSYASNGQRGPLPATALYTLLAALTGTKVQTLSAPDQPAAAATTVDPQAGRIVFKGRTYNLAGTRDESLYYADGQLRYDGQVDASTALRVEYRAGKLVSVSE
jgi:hypothetical protein